LLIGIDVGGTYTDGVLFHGNSIIAAEKRPTDENDLKNTLLQVLDELLKAAGKAEIKRIVLSTTLVTNILATGKGERTALILLPGRSLPYSEYKICPETYFLKGSIDFRGKETESLDKAQLAQIINDIQLSGVKKLAIASKFCNRNAEHEIAVKKAVQEKCPEISVSISSEISSKLNFPRRGVSTYFTAMTIDKWNEFADEIEEAIKARGLQTEIHILKADGGTMPLQISRKRPCETVFSGPAASTMGGLALDQNEKNSVVVDIGGTTSDISLIISGQPLYASRGARIEDKFTHVNAFALRSIALGGDSLIWHDEDIIQIGPQRQGVAACFGGEHATVTDVFNYHLNLGIGNSEMSTASIEKLAGKAGMDSADLTANIVDMAVERLTRTIRDMFREWENEPAYKVWEVINKRKFHLDRIIGIGAAAKSIIPMVAERMQVDCLIHEYSPVANALGASVVRPTLAVDLHIDTQNNYYTVDPGGLKEELRKAGDWQLEDARQLARTHLDKVCRERGMEEYAAESSFYMEEQFNVIRGWSRSGKIFDLGLQVSPGFIKEYKGVEI